MITMDQQNQHRELEEECSTVAAVNTTYNNDDRVPTYTGVMFEMFPQMDMELLTIELDLRIPEDEPDVDLSVEVYTMAGSYELLKAYDADRWTLVAEATAVLLPGGGAIIPASEFSSLTITAEQRRSFYITMKKSYIDHNVMALQKTGELQMRTPEFDLFVGVGFHEYKFPGDYDRNLDPQFAGVLHLRRTAECSKLVTTTTLTYDFLLNEAPTGERIAQVNQLVDDAVETMLQKNADLSSYTRNYDLEKNALARTGRKAYVGSCPEGWEYCPKVYLQTSIDFVHRETLDGSLVLYELYRVVESITNFVNDKLDDAQLFYSGYDSVSADISLILNGIVGEMDDVQLQYFSDVTTRFLQERTDNTVELFHLDISRQSIQEQPQRVLRDSRYLETDALYLEGRLLGSQTNIFQDNNFRDEVEETFRTGLQHYLDALILDGLRPGPISEENRLGYFRSIVSIEGSIVTDDVAQAVGRPGAVKTNSSTILLAVLLSICGVIFAGVATLLIRRQEHKKQKKVDRREMKDFRRQRSILDRRSILGSDPSAESNRQSPETLDSISEDSNEKMKEQQVGSSLDDIAEECYQDIVSNVAGADSEGEGSKLGKSDVRVLPAPPLAGTGSGISYSIGDYSGVPDTKPEQKPKRSLNRSLSFDNAGEYVSDAQDYSKSGRFLGKFLAKGKSKNKHPTSSARSVEPTPSRPMASTQRKKNREAEDVPPPTRRMPARAKSCGADYAFGHCPVTPERHPPDGGYNTGFVDFHHDDSHYPQSEGYDAENAEYHHHDGYQQPQPGHAMPPVRHQSFVRPLRYAASPMPRGPVTPMRHEHRRVLRRAHSIDDPGLADLDRGGSGHSHPRGVRPLPQRPVHPPGQYPLDVRNGSVTPMRHAHRRVLKRAVSLDDPRFAGLDQGGSGHGPGRGSQSSSPRPPASQSPGSLEHRGPMTPMRHGMRRSASFDDTSPGYAARTGARRYPPGAARKAPTTPRRVLPTRSQSTGTGLRGPTTPTARGPVTPMRYAHAGRVVMDPSAIVNKTKPVNLSSSPGDSPSDKNANASPKNTSPSEKKAKTSPKNTSPSEKKAKGLAKDANPSTKTAKKKSKASSKDASSKPPSFNPSRTSANQQR